MTTIIIVTLIILLVIIGICVRLWLIGSDQTEQDLKEEITLIQQTESHNEFTN